MGLVSWPRPVAAPGRAGLISTQCSSTLPSTTRLTSMLVKATCLPVGGMPWNSPRWVPRKATRAATVSPSAAMSCMVSRRSGNASVKGAVNCLQALQV